MAGCLGAQKETVSTASVRWITTASFFAARIAENATAERRRWVEEAVSGAKEKLRTAAPGPSKARSRGGVFAKGSNSGVLGDTNTSSESVEVIEKEVVTAARDGFGSSLLSAATTTESNRNVASANRADLGGVGGGRGMRGSWGGLEVLGTTTNVLLKLA